MKRYAILFAALIGLTATTASAQTPACDNLTAEAKAIAQNVLDTAYPYDCCDQTISACLKSVPQCKLPVRLADEICRLASANKSAQDIKHQLDQRAMTMSSLKPPVKIAQDPQHIWGNPNAKVVLSVYLCARCPYCSRHIPRLIELLETSPNKDKIAINLRLFPIKSHEHSTNASLGLEAAAKMGKAWPYLLKTYQNFDAYSDAKRTVWATELGLDAAQFDALLKDNAVRNAVVESKKEGLTNKVESTPTFFLNGRLIQGAFDAEAIISMLEESLDNVK